LIIEDEDHIAEGLRLNLALQGYAVSVAADGLAGIAQWREWGPDLIVLDIMLPKINGYEICRLIRKENLDMPIIMLTAKGEESDIILGLNLGADDYVTKPFGMRELLARIRAVLRRVGSDSRQPATLKVADVSLDRDTHNVRVDGRLIDLTPSEFDLLAALMEAPGRVYSRADLLIKLQGTTFEGVERTIDVHVRNLRIKLEPDPAKPRYIETVFGVGYRFKETLER